MISGRDSEIERVVGLELGADDYVVKPFLVRELVARMRAVLRRRPAGPGTARPGPARDTYGRVALDRRAHRAYLDGTEVPAHRSDPSAPRTGKPSKHSKNPQAWSCG